MNEILGYVSGNAIVAERNLQKFDGCKVRIEIMDKKTLELEGFSDFGKTAATSLLPTRLCAICARAEFFDH